MTCWDLRKLVAYWYDDSMNDDHANQAFGHDRGGRVAHRLAADHPQRVQTVAVLDMSPTLKMFERIDMAFALAYYHWS